MGLLHVSLVFGSYLLYVWFLFDSCLILAWPISGLVSGTISASDPQTKIFNDHNDFFNDGEANDLFNDYFNDLSMTAKPMTI